MVKNLPASQETQETQVRSLGLEDPLEMEMAITFQHSCLENPMDRGTWQATVLVVYSPGGHKEWATTGGLSATKPLSGRHGPAPLLIAGLQSQPSRRSQFPAQEVEEEDSPRPGPIPRRRPQCGSGPQGLGAAKSSAVRTGQHSH